MLDAAERAAEVTPIGDVTSAASIRPDGVFEQRGPRVGSVLVNAEQIFDTGTRIEDNRLFRLANRLHVRTRARAIVAQLLCKTGDRYSRRLLDKTERNLRQLPFLREPTISPTAVHGDVVGVQVTVRDVWTLQPGISFARSGGPN